MTVARQPARAPTALVAIAVAVLAAGWLATSCLELSWKEGIACDIAGKCPGEMSCCDGKCRRRCPERDAGLASDGPPVITCPVEAGGCFACMPGCPCTCGTTHATCCLQLGVATCAGCP